MNSQEIIILLIPAIIGIIIALLNNNSVNNFTEKIELWFRNSYTGISNNNGWFKRFALKPLLWLVVKFSDWTDSFTNRGVKNGVRIALPSI